MDGPEVSLKGSRQCRPRPRLYALRTFPARVAFLDKFLCIVPGTTRIGHVSANRTQPAGPPSIPPAPRPEKNPTTTGAPTAVCRAQSSA
ncbi:MAG: hypothetical protein CM1200mP18_07010 [Gammaproteobacteria bacterium]|nr:MAG: hypothetical protein CM1200mP18_07010 [Gammaproteobacteria bacterium]